MEALEKRVIELSNTCECRFCEKCGIGTESLECDECKEETIPTSYCDGMCYDYKLDWLEEDFNSYLSANEEPNFVRIDGKNMGWRNLVGYTVVRANSKELLESLSINGEWRIVFTFSENTLTVNRYSHDEPTGAFFTVSPVSDEEEVA